MKEVKQANDLILEEAKILSQKISVEHFQILCGEVPGKKSVQSSRLQKKMFKQYLVQKFGSNFAEKLYIVLDFTRAVDYSSFTNQVQLILKDRGFLLQVAFDLFDSNNDKKVSELDLFKVLYQFKQSPCNDRFIEIMYPDILCMSKRINQFLTLKKDALLDENGGDQFFVKRMTDFRNLQVLDKNFVNMKEKALQPVFEFKKPFRGQLESHRKSTRSPENRKQEKIPHCLESMKRVKRLVPLISGNKDLLKKVESNDSIDDKAESGDSDDEFKKAKDFFEQMPYW